MVEDKKHNSRHILGKTVVSKTGKTFGVVGNISFETRTGELLHISIKNPTAFAEGIELERDKTGNYLLPYSAVVAVGDFVVVSEEDII